MRVDREPCGFEENSVGYEPRRPEANPAGGREATRTARPHDRKVIGTLIIGSIGECDGGILSAVLPRFDEW